MQAVTTIGLDIAKSVFQIRGVDAAGHVIVRRQLKRRYVLPFFQNAAAAHDAAAACNAATATNSAEGRRTGGPQMSDA
jgi:transposase